MSYLFDFFVGRTITRDQLGKLGGHDRFIPPPPEFPPGAVDSNGVLVTRPHCHTPKEGI